MSERTRARGFTLIEMSAVIVVIMLFAAMITPGLLARQRSRNVVAFFVKLPDLAVYAREQAQSQRATMRLRFDEADSQFIVERTSENDAENRVSDSDDQVSLRRLGLQEGLSVSSYRQEDETVSGGEWEILFYPDGQSNGAAVEIDDNGRRRAVIVDRNGSIRLEQGPLPAVEERRWPAGDREQRA